MRKYYDAARCAVGSDYYRPVAMLLALCLLLVWQGMVQAEVFSPAALEAAQLPDAIHGVSADRAPPGLSCTDDMDFSPDDVVPGPADAESVAHRPRQDGAFAQPAAAESGCLNDRPTVVTV